ncbi:MAG: hypothetical protein RL417_2100 [Pseudomonadota bacterium]|jgi:pimeloyl-ACP methyl ester carboxylesterase
MLSITLPGNRRLTFALYGSTDRTRWLIYLHGFPGSRLEGSLFDELARVRGITVLAPDRPGFGSSETYPDRSLLDWPQDVAALCRALAINRAALVGVSGGGPYALACAWALPELLSSAQVVSSLAPIEQPGIMAGMAFGNRLMFHLMGHAPHIGRIAVRGLGAAWHASPELCLAWFRTFVPRVDKDLLDSSAIRALMLENIRTAFERGSHGPAADFSVITRPWGFSVADIKIPVTVWHGLADTYVPPVMGAYLSENIPGADKKIYPESGHLLVLEELREILERAEQSLD